MERKRARIIAKKETLMDQIRGPDEELAGVDTDIKNLLKRASQVAQAITINGREKLDKRPPKV